MSEAFSWSKILGNEGKEEAAASTEESTPLKSQTPLSAPLHQDLAADLLAEVKDPRANRRTATSPSALDLPSSGLKANSSGSEEPPIVNPPDSEISVEVTDKSPESSKTYFVEDVDEKSSFNYSVSSEFLPPPPKGNAFGDNLDQSHSEQYLPAHIPAEVHNIKLKEKRDINQQQNKRYHDAGNDAKPLLDAGLDDILREAFERKASDIHLSAGLPPMVRIDGELAPMSFGKCSPEDVRRLVYESLTDEHIQKFEDTHELDFAYSVTGISRYRFNVFMQRGAVSAAMRAIPTKIPAFESLGLPPVVREVCKRSSGLVLVTGPTGSGKSTTIASMIDDINESRTSHILTIEDPIEYLHQHKKCMINQRELHSDTYSFHNALRAVLREDPDIILVGELRDHETIEAALTMAETGHLVFGTLHTRNAPATVDRIVDVFPSDQQDQIRVLLGNTIEGVISQQLLPKLGGGRVASIEVMLGTPAIKNLIREGKTHQMYSIIETSSNVGMQTMDKSLSEHFKNGYVSFEDCLLRCVDKENFARLAKGEGASLRAG